MTRIIKEGNVYKIQDKFLFFWDTRREWLGCDNLGFDYGYGDLEFKSIEEAENYIFKNGNKKIEVIKYL